MSKYIIPATWLMSGEYEVEAETKEEALKKILKLPHPSGSYINNSLEIDLKGIKKEIMIKGNIERI